MDSDEIFGLVGFVMLLGLAGFIVYKMSSDDGYWIEEKQSCVQYETTYKCVKDTSGPDNEAVAICKTREECNKICLEFMK